MENWSSRRIRELAPEIALRGMAANKIGCARISMMVRSTSSKARPDTLVQDRTPGSPFSLATHGGSIHSGVKRTTPLEEFTLWLLRERPMPSHKFHIGESVMLRAAVSRNVPGGVYEVTKQLPHNGLEFEYRIKSANEPYERIAGESELVKP